MTATISEEALAGGSWPDVTVLDAAQHLAKRASKKLGGRLAPEELLGEAWIVAHRRAQRARLAPGQRLALYVAGFGFDTRLARRAVEAERQTGVSLYARRKHGATSEVSLQSVTAAGAFVEETIGASDSGFSLVERKRDFVEFLRENPKYTTIVSAFLQCGDMEGVATTFGVSPQRISFKIGELRRAYAEWELGQRSTNVSEKAGGRVCRKVAKTLKTNSGSAF